MGRKNPTVTPGEWLKASSCSKNKVRPILVERCLPCHGGGQQTMGDFDLSDRDSLVSSGKIGDTHATSRLLKLIRHEQEPHMPFQQAKLPDDAIDKIARWVELGAPYDEPLADKPSAGDGPLEITDKLWFAKTT